MKPLEEKKARKHIKNYTPEKGKVSMSEKEIAKLLMENELKALEHIKKQLKEPSEVIVDMLLYSSVGNYYIEFEYLANGTLFDFTRYLHERNKMTEEIVKAIFKNLLNLVNEIHKSNVSHLNLRLENVMFDEKGKMRLIDFGYSHISKSGIRIPRSAIGTTEFSAPETYNLKSFKKYIPRSADVFSLGIILFALYFGKCPFERCNETDREYIPIINEDYVSFWNTWYHRLESKFLSSSEELKLLIASMIKYLPETRLTLNEVINSQWIRSTTQARYEELNVYIRNLVIESKQQYY